MYEDILLPFDGSDGATAVLDHVADLARWADATVHLLYVADTTRDSVTVVQGETVDALAQAGEETLQAAVTALEDEPGVAFETDVVQGNPAPTIVDYAERYDQDLIVMPTHGHEGISRYLLGSVAEKVVRLSSVPVLTARMQADERLAFPYEDVLVPTDGSETAIRAADHGLALAAALDATVHALSVVDDSVLGPDGQAVSPGEEGEAAATEAVEAVAAKAEELGVPETVTHVQRGGPVETILDCIEANGIDAVVMGTTGRTGTDRILLGSVAEKTVRSAPVPVVTVGEGEE
jgi:nucleotide-binding universal stress UspA family protein